MTKLVDEVEDLEIKAAGDARVAFEKLSIAARAAFLRDVSWAEQNIGAAMLFGICIGFPLGIVAVWVGVVA